MPPVVVASYELPYFGTGCRRSARSRLRGFGWSSDAKGSPRGALTSPAPARRVIDAAVSPPYYTFAGR